MCAHPVSISEYADRPLVSGNVGNVGIVSLEGHGNRSHEHPKQMQESSADPLKDPLLQTKR